MKIDITSMFFNSKIEGQTATPAWGTSIGQNKSKDCRIDDFKQEVVDMVIGMTYKSISDIENLDVSRSSSERDIITCSVFTDLYINAQKIEDSQYVLLLVREHSKSHDGRLLISYAPYIKYNGIANQECIDKMQNMLGCAPEGCWFVYDISIKNQAELYFSAVVVNPTSPMIYPPSTSSRERSKEWKSMIPGDYEDFDTQPLLSEPLQQIHYGAPGTGKSHTINEITEQQPKENVFRTTFHPDSDYSTFVGCYKPCMINKEPLYKVGELINKLSEIKNSGVTYPCHKFAAKYWESLKDLSTEDIKKILTSCSFTESMNVEISKGVAIGEDLAKKTDNHKIVYSFVPQAFTKAYLRAWQTTEPVYLVIEEINRGNCAQIFGDLFQLLDRKCDGFSEYPIKADNDLAAYIAEKLSSSSRADIPELVRSGEELMLPSNLYIWATMNTSDQSLFPIDSAFKRRWEWKYIPIDTKKESWVINVDGTNYDWSDFLEKINAKIESATSSEDKMLGFYFCKAENNIISAGRFVSKVLFYLWNDVFKDYGFDDAIFNDDNNQKLSFRKFYKADGTVDENKVKKFLDNLQVQVENERPYDEDEEIKNAPSISGKRLSFWRGFNDARSTHSEYCDIYKNPKTPREEHFMDLSFNVPAYHPYLSVLFSKKTICVGISIYGTDRNTEIFEHFKENEAAINALAGVGLIFEKAQKPKNPDNPSYSIVAKKEIDINDESTWEDAYNWMMDMAVKMNEIKEKFGV